MYDANGATATRTPAGGTAQTLTWDAEQRLSTVKQGTSTVGSYVYTAEGERLIRKQGGKTTVYLPGGQELTLTTASGAIAAQRYYSFAGQTVATRTGMAASTVSSLFADTQGTALVSVQNITDTVTVRRTDPYGNVRGTNPSWPGDHLFLDKVRDSTGLTQVGARYYDASIGRFVSVDPVLDLKDPAQWSAYSYGEHNPVTYSDPTGLWSWASVKSGFSSAWKSTGNFVKKHQASIVGVGVGVAVFSGCMAVSFWSGPLGAAACGAASGAAAGAASNLWRTRVQKASSFTVGGFVRETVFGAMAGAIGGAAAKPLAAAASWAGRLVGPAAQRFGAGALSAARQAASKVSQALVRTAQSIRTQVVQQVRSAVQSVSRLLPSQSGRAGNVARVWSSTDPHVGDVANAIERAMPGRIASINSQRAQSNGLTREVDIDLGSLIIQVKSQNARGLTGQILRTQATTGTRTAGYAPDISDAAWRNAAREGVPILRTHEELMGFIREFG